MSSAPTSPTVVITGAGIVCALGATRQQVWEAVVKGTCGIGRLSSIEQSLPPGHGGGEVRDIADAANDKPREATLLRRALTEALGEAGIGKTWPCADTRVAVIMGTTLGGMRAAGRFLRTQDHEKLRDFTAAAVLQRALADLPACGLATSTCAACASGLSSSGLGLTLLRDGTCDLVIAGGYDPISEYTCAGFNSLRLVADGPPRPFSRHRQGMNLGEGYAVMVLERADDAQRRGATALAIVAGFGESSDAHHLTQPEPTGEGASRAIDAALRDAGINAAQIDVIAAHATATPQNDAAEVAAYQRIFGNHLPNVPVVAFKSHFGHTLGGAGSVELVMSLMAMGEQIIPPTATVRAEDNEFPGLNLVVDQPRRAAIERTLNVSMGFGGANACVILQRPTGDEKTSRHQDIKASRESQREVLITGVGVVLPGAVGNDAFVELLRTAPRGNIAAALNEYEYAHLFNARRARRMSDYVKLTLAATSLAMQDAGVDEAEEFARECGAILGTTHGAAAYSEMYYRQVVNEGIAAANPMLFAEGVPNVGSAQLSLMLGLKGGAQAIVGSRTAGLEALHLGAHRIASGACDRLIIGAAEERTDLLAAAYQHCVGPDLIIGPGAVTMVLESAQSAAKRSARPRGVIVATGSRRVPETDHSALRKAAKDLLNDVRTDQNSPPVSLAGMIAESFSVNGLAELAAALLDMSAACPESQNHCAWIVSTDPLGLAAAALVRCRIR